MVSAANSSVSDARASRAPWPRVSRFTPKTLDNRDNLEVFVAGVPFGIGAGLTLDEIAILTELDNPYWESEKLAAAQAAVAAVGAFALAARFQLCGRNERTDASPASDQSAGPTERQP